MTPTGRVSEISLHKNKISFVLRLIEYERVVVFIAYYP